MDEKTVPDISVGITRSKHWTDNNLFEQHGDRVKYEHDYPDYFPQSASNPQKPWVYPEKSFPDFRAWMREVYLKDKFPKYLETQEKKQLLPPSIVALALKAVSADQNQITGK